MSSWSNAADEFDDEATDFGCVGFGRKCPISSKCTRCWWAAVTAARWLARDRIQYTRHGIVAALAVSRT
jgi:hypothetical protein